MTKRDLVIRVANKLGMTQSDVAKVIEGAFDSVSRTLAQGERWELRDFGMFEVKTRASRMGRNPRTGAQVPVPERRVVTFRPGKLMKEVVSNPPPPRERGRREPEPAGEQPPYRPAPDVPPPREEAPKEEPTRLPF